MLAVLLALSSALIFGAMSVSVRASLARYADAEVAALVTIVVALVVSLVPLAVSLARHGTGPLADAWPFLLAGIVAPGGSQLLFTRAVHEVGASRTSVVVGAAPLVAIAIALTALGEQLQAGVISGAVLIVAGGALLVGERGRPEHLRLVGLGLAFASAALIAGRDNVVRWLATGGDVPPGVATAATVAGGAIALAAYLVATRGPRVRVERGAWTAFALPGVLFGASYVLLFEAYYHGRVTVVSPLVATESLWAVVFAVVFLRASELVGRRIVLGALLVVAGGALIGAFR